MDTRDDTRPTPHQEAERAEKLYDDPERREVEEANKKIKEESGKPREPLLPGERFIPPD